MGNMILFAVFLLLSCQMKGSTAVTPVFVQKGHDVLLEVKKDVPKKFVVFVWRFSEDFLVTFTPKSEPTVTERYTGRVEFSVENYSVKLKNLQKTDSGLYTARVTDTEGEKNVANYIVTVQDPVSPVNLIVDSVFNSTNPCNLTVTCRTQDSHISSTFTCDTQTCSQEEGERSKVTASGASLQVYLVNDSIICNHSNQVTWTKNQEQTKIWNFCPRHDENKQLQLIVGVLVVVLLLLLTAAVLYQLKNRKRRRIIINTDDTVYADPQVETANQTQTNDASPFTTYCLVGPHTGPMESAETRDRALPESIYAQVQKPVRSRH
ncbi:SLAM family member 5-like isoform X2 [Channa argus]|uniref:SLAM family member 5-like isoform X2 n=1 Tax=Channa argus TaxID=215402 RepID=UPI0035215652